MAYSREVLGARWLNVNGTGAQGFCGWSKGRLRLTFLSINWKLHGCPSMSKICSFTWKQLITFEDEVIRARKNQTIMGEFGKMSFSPFFTLFGRKTGQTKPKNVRIC